MNPEEALNTLDQMTSKANLTRFEHFQAQQAIKALQDYLAESRMPKEKDKKTGE